MTDPNIRTGFALMGTSDTSSPQQGHGEVAPEQVKPTTGAIEAAHQIGDAIVSTTCASRPEFWTTDTIHELAILIDRETGAADMLSALIYVRSLISEAAMTGFNCHEGSWAERLFASQSITYEAVTKAGWRRNSDDRVQAGDNGAGA